MIKKIILSLVVVVGFFSIAGMQLAFADDILDVCEAGTGNSAVCQDKTSKNPFTGPDGLLVKITDIVAYVAGAAAIIVFLISGMRYITSGGDSGKVSNAKSTLVNAFIGILIIVLGRTLIVYVLNRV